MKSILIVDDEIGARESLKMVFKDDYEVLLAKNAEEAFRQMKEQGPDVILLDILLPDLDGLKVLERMKREDPDAMVVMITATRTIKTAVEAMKLGAHDYVTKPFRCGRTAPHRQPGLVQSGPAEGGQVSPGANR